MRVGPSAAPLENWPSHILPALLSSFLFRFPDTRDKLQVYIRIFSPLSLSLSHLFSLSIFLFFSVLRKRQGLTRYLNWGFPSRRIFRSKFRTHFFSHWKLHHLCRFRDYFCRFVLSGLPVEKRTSEHGDRENRVRAGARWKNTSPEERSQYNGEQHYWLFKMVFTENNQSEGIMVRLVTPGTNDRRLLFPSSFHRSFISWL